MFEKLKQKMKLNKRGMGINEILPAALIIVVAVVGVSIGAQILGQIKSSQTVNSAEYNITEKGLEGIAKFGDWWGIIVTVIIAVIVISLIMLLMARRK